MTLVLNGTTGVSAVDGTASTPALQGNDTNTGVFFPAADTVALATSGAEAMRVDSSGNVGIGTSSPGGKLDVNGNIASGAASYVYSYAGGSSGTIRSGLYMDGTNQLLQFFTGANERARVTSSGELCIGATASAGYKLRVDGTTGAYVTTVNNNAIYGYASGSGNGVYGQSASAYGVHGYSTNSLGGYFVSVNNNALQASGLLYGVYGQTTASSYGGVIGFSQNGSYYGICGYSNFYSFYGNGNASITNGTWGTSDIRFKEVVDENPFAIGGPYDRSAIDIVMSIPVRAYKIKGPLADTSINGVDQFGWIAQEVEAVLPLAVIESPIPPNDIKTRAWIAEVPVPEKDSAEEKALAERDDLRYKSLNKDYLIASLWGAVQELKQQNDALAARVAALEAK